METNILEESKNKIIVEVKKEGHTLANTIVNELNQDSNTKNAAYEIKHEQKTHPTIILETSGEPKKALINAAKKLQKTLTTMQEQIKKAK